MKLYQNFILCLAITVFVTGAALLAEDHGDTPAVEAATAYRMLRAGNERYVKSKVSEGKHVADRRKETAQSQHPIAIVVCCSDSRVAPELVFDQNLGDLFVVRTAGEVVGDHALGSIEYAVKELNVRLIVVLGHERCGAVDAAIAAKPDTYSHIPSLLEQIQPAVKAVNPNNVVPTSTGAAAALLAKTVDVHAEKMMLKIASSISVPASLRKGLGMSSGVYDLDTGKADLKTFVVP